MIKFKDLQEAVKPKTIVLFFGRCQPPTVGHLLAFSAVTATAKKLGADYSIIISRTQDKKKNPLSISQKLGYLKILFPSIKFTGASDMMRTPIEVLKYYSKTYKNVVFVCGSDRVTEFKTLFDKYNGKEYDLTSIKVVSAGERDPDSDSASGMSSTKMRAAATKGDIKAFKKGLLPNVRDIDAKRMMNDVRTGLNLEALKEELKFRKNSLREKYISGKVFNEGEFVRSKGVVFRIINRNSNYLTVSNESGDLSRKWLTDVTVIDVSEDVIKKFEGIVEMKFTSTDKLKVARIIGGALGADAEKSSNAELIVNTGLRIATKKPLNKEALEIIKKMLQTADEAGIKYDPKLVPKDSMKEDVNEGKPVDSMADHYSDIRSKAEQAHAAGERHITLYKADQIIADRQHAVMNKLGGAQVKLPQGHSMGGTSDHHTRMKMKYKTEAVELDSDSDDDSISDDDIECMISHIDHEDDILDLYDPDELGIIDSDTGEHVEDVPKEEANEGELNEILSRVERIRSRIRFHKTQAKRTRALKISLKRHSTTKKLGGRAQKLAIRTLKEKLAKKPLSQMSVAEKERIERIVKKRASLVKRMSLKLIPRVRKIEQDRLSHNNYTKASDK